MKKLILTLLIICLITAAALGVVNAITSGRIEALLNASRDSAMQAVLPADANSRQEVEFNAEDNPLVESVFVSAEGYVVEVIPSGFGGAIDMMVGIVNDKSDVDTWEVSGVSIVSMSETSNLGTRANEPEWQAQFIGKQMSSGDNPFAVTKDGGDIDAITGATVTSRAVTSGINAAMKVVMELQGSEVQE